MLSSSWRYCSRHLLRIQLFLKTGNDWSGGKGLSFAEGSGNVFGLLETYLSEHLFMKLYDFDDHLEDISADWVNSKLFD
jgi:hypothetical protein